MLCDCGRCTGRAGGWYRSECAAVTNAVVVLKEVNVDVEVSSQMSTKECTCAAGIGNRAMEGLTFSVGVLYETGER